MGRAAVGRIMADASSDIARGRSQGAAAAQKPPAVTEQSLTSGSQADVVELLREVHCPRRPTAFSSRLASPALI